MRRTSPSRSINWCLRINPRWAATVTKKAMWLATWADDGVVGDQDEPQSAERHDEEQQIEHPLGPVSEQAFGRRQPLGPRRQGGPPPPVQPPRRQHEDRHPEDHVGGEQSVVAEDVEIASPPASPTGFPAAPAGPAAAAPADVERIPDGELGRQGGHGEPVQAPRHPPVSGSWLRWRAGRKRIDIGDDASLALARGSAGLAATHR